MVHSRQFKIQNTKDQIKKTELLQKNCSENKHNTLQLLSKLLWQ